MSLYDNIIDHLNFAVRRDADKGGSGLRTTRQIADRVGVNTPKARNALTKLANDGKVDRFASGDWRICEQYKLKLEADMPKFLTNILYEKNASSPLELHDTVEEAVSEIEGALGAGAISAELYECRKVNYEVSHVVQVHLTPADDD